MLVDTALYLANCDSVHGRTAAELRERLIWGLAFADRVILTPNIIIDNPEIDALFQSHTVRTYLERNPGKLVIRHNHSRREICFVDYFDRLPADFIVSSHPQGPRKRDLPGHHVSRIKGRLSNVDALFERFAARHEKVALRPDSLSNGIRSSLAGFSPEAGGGAGGAALTARDLDRIRASDGAGLHSRSAWYHFLRGEFAAEPAKFERIRSEIVDPAYNNLFVNQGEAFASDRIKGLSLGIQEGLLFRRAHEREFNVIRDVIRIARFVHTLGVDGAVGWLVDLGKEQVRDYLAEHGEETVTASRTWQRMHARLIRYIGVGIKQ